MCASPNQMVFRILAGRLDMFDTFDDEFGFQGRRLLSMKNTNHPLAKPRKKESLVKPSSLFSATTLVPASTRCTLQERIHLGTYHEEC